MFGLLLDYPVSLLGGLLVGLVVPAKGWRNLAKVVVLGALPGFTLAFLDFAVTLLFITPTQGILLGVVVAILLCCGLGIIGGLIGAGMRAMTGANRA